MANAGHAGRADRHPIVTTKSERSRSHRRLPTGTVTFLRSDVEGSMKLVRALGSAWDDVNAVHLGIIRDAVEKHGGVAVRTEGDALFAAFPEAGAAIYAAIDAQRALRDHAWPVDGGPRVRMGLHSGQAHLSGDDYGGFEVNRAARIAAAGHGGQIVVSASTRALVADVLPADMQLRDLGEHALKDVPRPERLYQLEVPGLPASFPPLRTRQPAAGNVPTRLTTFLGRDAELVELGALLEEMRLVTLTGPGGIGKTSLGTELARAQAARFRDGAWFVALDLIGDADLVMTVIARTVGLFDGPERAAANGLLAYVTDRSMLFVLDNFEHVLDAAGGVTALLRASPASRVIVTSRAPLRIPGEQEYPVRPLIQFDDIGSGVSTPEWSSPDAAVRLFVDRARAVRPDWQPDGQTPVIREICRLLDGLPLGIELAAARISLLPAAAIRDRLTTRVPLPGSGPRDVPARQRTLDAAIGWSYDLLSPQHQWLLDRLSVFDGGFDAEQAGAVAATPADPTPVDVLDGLMSLADQSLVIRDSHPRAEAMPGNATGVRVRLLNTIQAFAAGRLAAGGEERPARRRHALAYLDLAEAAARNLPGPDQPRWLDRLAVDDANLRTALRWAIDSGETDIALRFLPALWRFWQLDGHLHEGRALADAALSMPGADAPTAARVAAVAAGGNLAYWQADSATARRRYEEQLELARRLQDPVAEADAVFNLAHVVFVESNDGARAARFLEDARERFESIGDARGVARCDWARGTMFMTLGRPVEAAAIFRELLRRFEELGDVQYHAMTASSLGWTAYVQGDVMTAAKWVIRGLVESHRMRDATTTSISIQEGVIVAMALDRPAVAALLTGAFEGLCERYGVRPPASLQQFLDRQDPLANALEALHAKEFQAAFARGRRMSLDEAVAVIVELGDSVEAETS
jgi:predicted ATPase/class 3 adenylate cyclase